MDADLGQEALTLMTYPLPKGPPPNTITLGVRIEHINLGGENTNIQTTAPCDSSRA